MKKRVYSGEELLAALRSGVEREIVIDPIQKWWTSEDGKVTKITELNDNHLINIISKIKAHPPWKNQFLHVLEKEHGRRMSEVYKSGDAFYGRHSSMIGMDRASKSKGPGIKDSKGNITFIRDLTTEELKTRYQNMGFSSDSIKLKDLISKEIEARNRLTEDTTVKRSESLLHEAERKRGMKDRDTPPTSVLLDRRYVPISSLTEHGLKKALEQEEKWFRKTGDNPTFLALQEEFDSRNNSFVTKERRRKTIHSLLDSELEQLIRRYEGRISLSPSDTEKLTKLRREYRARQRSKEAIYDPSWGK